MQKSRTRAVVINSSFAIVAQLLNLILSFVVRTILIKTLGSEFNGLNGLFSNIVNVLSFAELGIGSAISFSLYAPLANNDKKQVAAIMSLFRKIYHVVAAIIVVTGLLILPFLDVFIHGSTNGLGNIHIAFALFVANVVFSYLMSYKRTILIANQEGYIDSLNRMIFTFCSQILQITMLLVFPNYYYFLIIQILTTIISNFPILFKVKNKFPYLQKYSGEKVERNTIQYLKKNVIGMLSFKLGNIVIIGTDNIILSSFMGLTVVGMYANYTLIITGLTSVMNSVINSVTASIGNLAHSSSAKKQSDVFFKMNFVNAIVALVVSLGLVTFFPVFIKYWLGTDFMFSRSTTLLIGINFFIAQLRNSLINFLNAYGLYWQQRYKSIVEALVNFSVSILLISCTELGVKSVLIGTLVSSLIVDMWWEPLIVIRNAIKESYIKFMILYFFEIFGGIGLLVLFQNGVFLLNEKSMLLFGIFLTVVSLSLGTLIYNGFLSLIFNIFNFSKFSYLQILRKRN